MAKDLLFVNRPLHRCQFPARIRHSCSGSRIGRSIIVVGAQRECEFAEPQGATGRILKRYIPQQGSVVREAIAHVEKVALNTIFTLRAPCILDSEHLSIESNLADIRRRQSRLAFPLSRNVVRDKALLLANPFPRFQFPNGSHYVPGPMGISALNTECVIRVSQEICSQRIVRSSN